VMNPDGSGVRLLSEAVDTGAAWSPDGSRIAFVGGFDEEDISIYVMRADGTDVRRVTDGGSLADGEDLGPSWSPDGMRIAFARGGDIFTVNADGTSLVRLTEGPVVEYEPAWSPEGSRIAFEGYDLASGGQPPSSVRLYVMNADGTNITEVGPKNVQGPAWSPDGTEIAYVDTESGSIMAVRPDGTEPRRILNVAPIVGGVHLVYDVAWSPDGTKLAFMAGPDSEDTHIYVVNRDGSDVRRLTNDQAPDYSPAWQPVPEGQESTMSEGVAYLPPYLRADENWDSRSSRPAAAGNATWAWASTIPLRREHEAVAIPTRTITALPRDGIVITALTVMSGYDLSLGPFPFDLSGLSLTDARMRTRRAEEPPGDYAVLETYVEPALVRVYFGTPSPSERLIERARREVDTLQVPPICPVPARGGYGAELSTDSGVPGDRVTVSGPMPFLREDGSYTPNDGTRMIVWWNGSPDDWPYLSSFSNVEPSPDTEGSPLLRLGEGGRDSCRFSVSFTVPEVPPGDYPIVVLQEGGGSSAIAASLVLHVR
jgi:WD40 repeat protein